MNGFSRTACTYAAALGLAGPTSRLAAQGHDHEKIGAVHFATSCAPAAGPQFDRSVALLHSFEFGAAIAGFRSVLRTDSTCAMAYWGIALSRWTNPMAPGIRPRALLSSGQEAAAAATRLSASKTRRERDYAAAVATLYDDYEHRDQENRVDAYERAMADLVQREPADTEAKIFHAIALVAAARPTDKSYANQLRAGATLETLWKAQPDHPGLAHYIIHAYDVPALAPRAADAARRYADIAPGAAHALHMPSHTFTRLGLWEPSIESNRRSALAALRDSSIAEVLHASDYMEYAYLQLRRDRDAKVVLDGLPALALRFDPNAVTGAAPGSAGIFALAAIPARYALERRAWDEAAALPPKTTTVAYADAVTWFARALGSIHVKEVGDAKTAIDSLGAMDARLADQGETYWAEQVAIQRLDAEAWLALADGRRDAALSTMRAAARREDATEKSAVTPGPLLPARELLGDMLLELKRPADARAEFERVLAKEPNRFRALDGARAAALAAGDRRAAAAYAARIKSVTGVDARNP